MIDRYDVYGTRMEDTEPDRDAWFVRFGQHNDRIRELEAALDAEKAIHTVWLARFGEPATAPHCPTCSCSQSMTNAEGGTAEPDNHFEDYDEEYELEGATFYRKLADERCRHMSQLERDAMDRAFWRSVTVIDDGSGR